MAEGHNRFTQHRVELGWLPPANHDPNLAWIEYFNEHVTN